MKQFENQFNYLNLINKQKKNNIRAQVFEIVAIVIVAVKKHKEMKRFKRKSKLSIDSTKSKNITMSTNIIKNSILQKINEILNVQNVNINQIVERMNIMKTIFIKFTTINLRIKIKLNHNKRFNRHHTKKRANLRKFKHFVDFQSFKNNQSKFVKYSKKKIIINSNKKKTFQNNRY